MGSFTRDEYLLSGKNGGLLCDVCHPNTETCFICAKIWLHSSGTYLLINNMMHVLLAFGVIRYENNIVLRELYYYLILINSTAHSSAGPISLNLH